MGVPFPVLLGVGAALGLVVVAQSADLRLPGDGTGYEPEQPVAFSHQTHAGELAIPCLYCHTGAETGRAATLPPASTCMGCHQFVRASFAAVRAEDDRAKAEKRDPRPITSDAIRSLYRLLGRDDEGKRVAGAPEGEIPWVRVHDLPDFVVFDHRSHVAAGVACATCHGAVETMARVRQVESLSMGWCVACHRQETGRTLARPVLGPDGKVLSPTRALRPTTDCSVCHH